LFLVPQKDVLAPKEWVRGGRECFFGWWWGEGCHIAAGGFARGSRCLAAAEEEEEERMSHTTKALCRLHTDMGRHVDVETIK